MTHNAESADDPSLPTDEQYAKMVAESRERVEHTYDELTDKQRAELRTWFAERGFHEADDGGEKTTQTVEQPDDPGLPTAAQRAKMVAEAKARGETTYDAPTAEQLEPLMALFAEVGVIAPRPTHKTEV